jgi:hypothetical protein
MKIPFFAAAISLIALLSGCTDDSPLNDAEVKELVADLSGSSQVSAASIDDKELTVEDEGKKSVYSLPEDEFFISIAPYETVTHPCEIHSLTGCQGELAEKEMKVTITDAKGEVHLDKAMTTPANGFIDFWLPRDETYTIQVESEGKTGETVFSTFDGDPTCLTELPMAL